MSRSRRFLLFSPLVVLTLFFVACGWRNWNLPMEEEEVFAAVADYYRSPQYLATNGPDSSHWAEPDFFADNSSLVLSLHKGLIQQPVFDAFIRRLERTYPKTRFTNASWRKSSLSFGELAFEDVQFIDRFRAKCVVHYMTSVFAETERTFIFKRSPIDLRGSRWQIEETNTKLIYRSFCGTK